MPALAGAMSAAAIERLAFLDAQLALPLRLSVPVEAAAQSQSKAAEVDEAARLARLLLRQLDASLWRLCQPGSSDEGGSAAEVAAAGVCRAVFARLPLVVTFCNDRGASARAIWKTLLSAAAALRCRAGGNEDGEGEGQAGRVDAGSSGGFSPYAGLVWELLERGGGGGGEGLYDIPAMHSELGAALIESLVAEAEALLAARGGDLLQWCNGGGAEAGAAWGCRALVALRRAVKKRENGAGKKDTKGKKDKKDKKSKKDTKRDGKKRRAAESDADSGGEEGREEAAAARGLAAA